LPSGVTLAVEEQGDPDGVPIVLLHGLTATRRYVVMGSNALARAGRRVVLYDARGHGSSSPAPSPGEYTYVDLVADLRELLDALGVERAVLAGVSMGAQTIIGFALANPERVAALALITPAFDPRASPSPERLARWDALAAGLQTGGPDGFLAAYGTSELPERWRETLIRVIRQRLSLHEHPEAVADAMRALARSRAFQALSELERIAAPTVVVASHDEADPDHPYTVGQAWAEAIRGARLASEEPGHSPLAWQGGRIARLIDELVP